jgi:hypothetical protein
MSEDAMITIKRGAMKISVPRSELIDVSETHDGVAFNFKGGIQIYYTNNFMQPGVKNVIKNTADSYPGKKLIFDLDNPRQPALVDAT